MTVRRAAQKTPLLSAASGIAQFGDRVVVWGRDLHRDCMTLSFVHYYLFCATGRWFDASQARVWERLWISTGYPDARLWCNRVAGYMGTARVPPGLALSAAIAASDSQEYGFGALRRAYQVQRAIPKQLAKRSRWLKRQIDDGYKLAGYGRPVSGSDERLAVTYRVLGEEKFPAGPALKRAHSVSQWLYRRKGIELNVAGAWAAIAIDFGMAEAEFEVFMLLMLAPGYMAVYTDQARRSPMQFLAGYRSRLAESEPKHRSGRTLGVRGKRSEWR